MKPATRLTSLSPVVHRWSSFHPQWKVDFSSYAVVTGEGVYFVDPLRPAPTLQPQLTALGAPLGVFLTNANHERDADWFRKEYDIHVFAHEKTRPECDIKLDILVLDGEILPGGPRVLHVPGGGAGESALIVGDTVLLGDALLHPKGQALALLPAQYCEDAKQLARSLRQLLDVDFQTLTFAHGEPIVGQARAQLAALLKPSRKKKP
jgi:glyoxylase-like metal-dependent hydrolase (beta-lactamase superfamily II)